MLPRHLVKRENLIRWPFKKEGQRRIDSELAGVGWSASLRASAARSAAMYRAG
jgi:hypothetical protein